LGEAGPDGDLVLVVPVEGLDVERGEQGFFDPVGRVGEQRDGDGEGVEQVGVVVGGRGGVQVG
jgi:hypothetical protein